MLNDPGSVNGNYYLTLQPGKSIDFDIFKGLQFLQNNNALCMTGSLIGSPAP